MFAYLKTFTEKQDEIRQKQDIDEETRKKQSNENMEQFNAKLDSLSMKVFSANKNNALGTFIGHVLNPLNCIF